MKTGIALLGTSSIAGMVAASPMPRAISPSYFFTFGNSYTMTTFDVSGEQPTASDPMGNPALGGGTTAGGSNWIGYLTTEQNASLVLSYNLAIGGASIDNSIVQTSNPDMVSQVETFESAYSDKPDIAPWDSESAVFGFWIGINDIGWAYSSTDANVVVPELMARYEELAEKLYADGGRKFLFLNVPPTSRSPNLISQGSDAAEKHAAWLDVFNKGMQSMVKDFKASHSDVTTVLYDSWSFMNKVLDNPQNYGFPDATCINSDGTSCIWWNDYHPGSKYHRLQAEDMKPDLKVLGAW